MVNGPGAAGFMDIPIRVLRYFTAAARLGSITAAAEYLNISQPSVSAAITRIEEDLNVQVFIRRPSQGVRLTPAGQRVFDEARPKSRGAVPHDVGGRLRRRRQRRWRRR